MSSSAAATATQDGSLELQWKELKLQPDPIHGSPLARSSHGVSYLPHSHQLFVYGGEHVARTPLLEEHHPPATTDKDDTTTVIYIYAWLADLPSLTWKALTTTSLEAIPPVRIAHAQAVVVDDNDTNSSSNVYIFGGRAGITMQENAMNDLWVWNSHTHLWTNLTPSSGDHNNNVLPEARSFHRMVALDQKLYVFGGCGQESGRLADLHAFDLQQQTWSALDASSRLAGRGGPNLVPLQSGTSLAVVNGFVGHETNDGHVFDVTNQAWANDHLSGLDEMRPRSVCVAASFSKLGVAVIFGGEVDPSERGHEGAGGFANDVVLLNEGTGALVETIAAPAASSSWPGPRGWSAGDASATDLFVFGGLAGDDKLPIRLNDLWQLTLSSKTSS